MLPRRERTWLPLLLLLTVVAYARVLRGDFQFDDFENIERNPAIKQLGESPIGEIFSGWLGASRPLTNLTFALNYAAGGLDATGYHAVNLAIHLAAIVLAWALARSVAQLAGADRSQWIALAVATVFALHPLQTQAVSYVVQRSESLSSAFYILTLLLLLEAERRGRTAWGLVAFLGAMAAFLLAIGAKPIAVTVPATYLLLAAAVAGTPMAASELTSWPRRLMLSAPLFAAAAATALGAITGIGGRPDAGFDIPDLSPGPYFLTQLRALVSYLRLLLWPAGQSADWDFAVSRSLSEPAVLASAAILAALAVGAVALLVFGRRWPDTRGAAARLAGLGVAWFFVVLSVTSSLVPLADVFVEHRIYLASWGLFLAIAAGAERAARTASPRQMAAALVLLSCVLAGLTYRRNAVWETRESLWRDVLAKSPHNPRARLSLGFALAEHGRYREAIAEYRAGIPAARGVPKLQAQLLRNLGGAHTFLGEFEAAAVAYQQGLSLDPENDELMISTGIVLMNSGDLAGAEHWVQKGLDLAPDQPTGWNVLGVIRLRRGQWREALEALDRAVAVDPDMGEVHVNRATALTKLGRADEACAAWMEATRRRLAPQDREPIRRAAEAACGTNR